MSNLVFRIVKIYIFHLCKSQKNVEKEGGDPEGYRVIEQQNQTAVVMTRPISTGSKNNGLKVVAALD